MPRCVLVTVETHGCAAPVRVACNQGGLGSCLRILAEFDLRQSQPGDLPAPETKKKKIARLVRANHLRITTPPQKRQRTQENMSWNMRP